MKFSCSKNEINEIITHVSLAVATKSTIPILEGILLICQNQNLTVTCYNLELGISKTIPISGSEEGRIVLNTNLLSSIIAKMPDGQITFQSDSTLLTHITCQEVEFTVAGMDASNFPDLPIISNDKQFKIPQHIIRTMLEQTLFAAAQSDQNPINTGCLFDINNHLLTIVTVDGYRLALRKEPVSVKETVKVIVPAKTLTEILRLLVKLMGENDEREIAITTSSSHIVFDICGYYMISRIMEGEFIDYKKVIPVDCQTKIKIKTKELIDSVNRATIIISDKTKAAIKCTAKDNSMNLYCETTLGKVSEFVSVQFEGDAVRLGFNNKYMLDALKACDCSTVTLELNGPLSPIKLLPEDDDHFLFLVLPIRLKDDD